MNNKNFLYIVPRVSQINLYLRVNPKDHPILTSKSEEGKLNWPEFKLNLENRDKIPSLIPIMEKAIQNIDIKFRELFEK